MSTINVAIKPGNSLNIHDGSCKDEKFNPGRITCTARGYYLFDEKDNPYQSFKNTDSVTVTCSDDTSLYDKNDYILDHLRKWEGSGDTWRCTSKDAYDTSMMCDDVQKRFKDCPPTEMPCKNRNKETCGFPTKKQCSAANNCCKDHSKGSFKDLITCFEDKDMPIPYHPSCIWDDVHKDCKPLS